MVPDQATGPTLSRPERWLTVLAMVGVGLLSLIVTTTIVSRWVYRAVIPDDVMLVREIMIWVIVLPLAAVTCKRMHIAVTIFTDKVAPRTMRTLERVGNTIGLVFVGLLLWGGWTLFVSAWESGEYYDGDMNIPMWITQGVYVVGLAAFFVRLSLSVFSKGPPEKKPD